MSIDGWKGLPFWLRVVISSAVAFLMSISAISAGLITIEPWIPAHRQLARDLVAAAEARSKEALAHHAAETIKVIAPTKIGLYDIQIGIAQARRSTINDQIFAAEINAPKSDSAEELIKRRQQLQKLKDELTEIESTIRLLRDQRERN